MFINSALFYLIEFSGKSTQKEFAFLFTWLCFGVSNDLTNDNFGKYSF